MSISGSVSAVCPSSGIKRRCFSRGLDNLQSFASSECMGFCLQVPVLRTRASPKVRPLQVYVYNLLFMGKLLSFLGNVQLLGVCLIFNFFPFLN